MGCSENCVFEGGGAVNITILDCVRNESIHELVDVSVHITTRCLQSSYYGADICSTCRKRGYQRECGSAAIKWETSRTSLKNMDCGNRGCSARPRDGLLDVVG